MVKSRELGKPIELDSESVPEIELNLVESSEAKEEEMGVQNEPVTKPSSEPKKKQLFQRLWSEADEIVILKGMIDYEAMKKTSLVADLNGFYDFIKKDIHFEFSISQLKNKIMKLRMKYKNNKSKEKNGKRRTFGKPHKQEAYDLSEKVWNCEGKVFGGTCAKKKENKKGGKIAQAAEEWKSLEIQEIEAYMTQLEVKKANLKMALDHLKSCD